MVKSLSSDDDSTFFLHSSGGMFVCIPNYYSDYSSRSRHASSVVTRDNNNASSNANTSQTATRTLLNHAAAVSNSSPTNSTPNNSTNSLTQSMTRSTSSAAMLMNKVNEKLKNNSRLAANINSNATKRDRSITESGGLLHCRNINDEHENRSSNKTCDQDNDSAINNESNHEGSVCTTHKALSSSMVANSNLTMSMMAASNLTRERSNTKSQHIQYLRLNETNYKIDVDASDVTSTNMNKSVSLWTF
jgi:hypothetical protein